MNMENELMNKLQDTFGESIEVIIQRDRRIKIKSEMHILKALLSYLKNEGYTMLTMISAIDWLKLEKLELVYNIYSHGSKINALISINIPRDEPKMESITNIYHLAEYYEREIHEMFGVSFEGNPNFNLPLLLEDWQGPPPMRKDFNTRKFVEEKYGMKDLTAELFKRKPQSYRG